MAKAKIDFQKARQMYEAGVPMAEIAEHFGVGTNAIRVKFRRMAYGPYAKTKETKGGADKVGQKQKVIPLPDSEPDYKAMYEKALADKGTLDKELSVLRQDKETMKDRISALTVENTTLRQSRLDAPEIIREAVKPMFDELRQELHALKAEFRGLDVKSLQKGKPVYVDGWSVLQSPKDKFFRAFKTVGGKQRSVYIGKNANPAIVRAKTQAAIEKNREKWGLSLNDTTTDAEPSPAGENQAVEPDRLIKSLIRKHAPSSGTAAIYKVRRDFMEATGGSREQFSEALSELARNADIQLLHGDPNDTPADELKLNPYDSVADCHYCSVQWTGDGK